MSSKKKLHKEKEDIKAVKSAAFVLKSDKAVVARSNDYPLSSDVINILYGRPYGALNSSDWLAPEELLDKVPPFSVLAHLENFTHENLRRAKDQSLPKLVPSLQGQLGNHNHEVELFAVRNWTPRQLQRQWEDKVASRLGSLVVHPRHWVSFSYSTCPNSSLDQDHPHKQLCLHESSHPAFALAEVITRLVAAHAEWNNVSFLNTSNAGLMERLRHRSMSVSYASFSAIESFPSFSTSGCSSSHANGIPNCNDANMANESQRALQQGYEPVMDVRKLLGLSIRSTFAFPTSSPASLSSSPSMTRESPLTMKEERDVSFQVLNQARKEEEIVQEGSQKGRINHGENSGGMEGEKDEASLAFLAHYNSTYVNVCCGKYYYQLPVLDTEKRSIKTITALSSALDMIYADVREKESAFQQLNVSNEVREDFKEFYGLLARVSATPSRVREDIYRRLCEVSEVNANNLTLLDGALFTIVINGSEKPSERAADAQWLHSVFSLHFQWDQADAFCATAAALVSADTILLFLKRALAGPHPGGNGVPDGTATMHRNGISTGGAGNGADCVGMGMGRRSPRTSSNTLDLPATAAGGFGSDYDKVRRELTSTRNTGGEDVNNVCSHSGEKAFKALDLWLPLKHRVALRPYTPICSLSHKWYSPSIWFPQSSGSHFTSNKWAQNCLTASQFCVLVILAVERVLCMNTFHINKLEIARRPSVLFAYHHPECTYPSVVSLVTNEVVEWIQAVRSPSALITQEVRATTKQRAIESVTCRLQECIESPISFYGLSRSAYQWTETEEPADMCITFAFLTHSYQQHCGSFKVLSTGSDFRIPSRMIINGLALQKRPEKRVMFGSGEMCPGDLGVAPTENELGKAFVSALNTEFSEF